MCEVEHIEVGVNTFGLGKLLAKDYEGTMRRVAEQGADAIEPCILFMGKTNPLMERVLKVQRRMPMMGGIWLQSEAPAKIKRLREMGLKVHGIHMMAPGLNEGIVKVVAQFAMENDLNYVVFSNETDDLNKAAKALPGLRAAVKVFKENGIIFMYHNHEKEWIEKDGDCVLDFFMDSVPGLDFQIDLGWAEFIGRNCVEMMEKYRNRIRCLHFKDVYPGARQVERRNCFTAVGEGCLPIAAIMEKAKELDLPSYGYVIDQDASFGDMIRDIRIGIDAIRAGESYVQPQQVSVPEDISMSILSFPFVKSVMSKKSAWTISAKAL